MIIIIFFLLNSIVQIDQIPNLICELGFTSLRNIKVKNGRNKITLTDLWGHIYRHWFRPFDPKLSTRLKGQPH